MYQSINALFRIFVLVALVVFVSCNKDDLSNESPTQLLEIGVNNESLTFIGKEFAGNENCGRLFINLSSTTSKSDTKFMLSIDMTTDGRVKEVFFVEYSDQNRHYRTADFVSSENFFIQNFRFDSSSRALSFEFTGKVYQIDSPTNTKSLSGKVKFDNFKSIPCSYNPWWIKANINQVAFKIVDMGGMSNSEKGEWLAFSNDGFKIALITRQPLRDMPVGRYSFAKDDLLDRVVIEKYIGAYKATTYKYVDNEWEKYQYEGELVISEQVKGTTPYTKGTFRLNAYKNQELVYQVMNGEFSI